MPDGDAEAQPDGVFLEPTTDGRLKIDFSSAAFELRAKPDEDGGWIISRVDTQHAPSDFNGEGRWEKTIAQWVQEKVKDTEELGLQVVAFVRSFATGVIQSIEQMVLILMLGAFILIDMQRIRGFIRSLVPHAYREDYDRIAQGADKGLSGVIRGQLLICLINGVLTYIGLLIFEVNYPLLLAGVASVLSLIPIFGSVVSSVPIVAVALISSGSLDIRQGLFVTGWIIFIHLIEANYLNPKIMGDAAKIHRSWWFSRCWRACTLTALWGHCSLYPFYRSYRPFSFISGEVDFPGLSTSLVRGAVGSDAATAAPEPRRGPICEYLKSIRASRVRRNTRGYLVRLCGQPVATCAAATATRPRHLWGDKTCPWTPSKRKLRPWEHPWSC